MDQQQADALNRAAQFHPRTTDDELPAIEVGGALVLVYVKPSPSGRPVLVITLDTETVAPDMLAADGVFYHRHDVNDTTVYTDSTDV